MTQVRLSAVTKPLIPRQALASTHASSFSIKMFFLTESVALDPSENLTRQMLIQQMGPRQMGTPFVFCSDVATGSVLAPAPTKTGGLCSLIDSGHMSLLLRTSASQEGLVCCLIHLCPSPMPQHSLHARLSLATV